jgi:hypothetical protein
MREIKIVNESYGLKSYLITSDEYMVDVAQQFGIFVVDPEAVSISTLPADLDIRLCKRHRLHLRAICTDPQGGQAFGSTSTIDISRNGLKVHHLVNLTQGRLVKLRLETFDGAHGSVDAVGEVCWVNSGCCGVKLAESLPVNFSDYFHLN